MKKLKLLFATLALLVGGVSSVNATNWEGNVPAAGEFYLYNVGADRFLGYGANWGTRATVEHAGIPVTLTSVSDGVYTIVTNVVENGKGLIAEGYVDGTSANWTFSAVAGQTNTYQISTGGNYLFWDSSNANSATSVSTTLPSSVANSYWKLVTKAQRDAAFTAMNATESAPLDITYKYIENPNTTYYTNIYSNANPWGGNSWKLDGYQNWQDAKDQCGERYNMNFDTYITIENIPNGEYEFGVQGFYRDGLGDAAIQNYHDNNFTPNAKIYANSNTTDMQSIAVANRTTEFNSTDSKKEISGTTYYVPNNQYMAEVYTYAGYYPWQNVKTIVTDGTLRFGVKKESTISNDWTIVDKFYLSYLGPTIAAKASALPAGDMTANTWYYFDIALDGEYNLTLTTLSDIVYTTDNTILFENENGVTANFSGTSAISMTAGRYYVKSASAQTLTVAANSYNYTVGDPTSSVADNSYQQTVSTVTLNFASAATNDPDATFAILDNTAKAALKLSGSTIAEGTLSLDGKVLTATFPETALTIGSTYTLELPANVVGYAGQALNTAVSINIKTPAFADGFYYLYNTYTNTYLSRSGNYGTQAILDNRGLAVKITTDTEGKSIVQYFDNLLYLGNNGFCYGDAGTAHQFTVTAVTGGYKFLCVSNSKYLAVLDGQSVNDAVEGSNLQGTSNIWALETPAQHMANYTRNANTQAATAAANVTALSNITTKAALETELSANYGETSVAITGEKNAKYQNYAGNGYALSEAEYYKETVENLTPGLYKLSVDAFQRAAWYDWVANAGGARGNIYVYANNAKTQIKSVMEYGADAAYTQSGNNPNMEINGKNYPNNDEAAYAALSTGNYTNDVYVYVAADEGKETGTLVFGINNPTRQGNGVNNGTWAVYQDFTLTYFSKPESVTITSAGLATYTSDNALDFSNISGLKAYKAKVDGTTVKFTEVTTVPAGEGVLLEGVEGQYDVTVTTGVEAWAAEDNDFIRGTGAAVETGTGDVKNYILSTDEDGNNVGFYYANGETVATNKAYIQAAVSAGSRLMMVFDGEATGIRTFNKVAENGALYNLNGARVIKPTKGLYIQDGKKVVIK